MSQLLPSGVSSPEQQMMARERAQAVSTALEDLSPNQRTIFMLRFIEEMDLSEICQTTGMQISTVKTHLHCAAKAVRRKLGGEAVHERHGIPLTTIRTLPAEVSPDRRAVCRAADRRDASGGAGAPGGGKPSARPRRNAWPERSAALRPPESWLRAEAARSSSQCLGAG